MVHCDISQWHGHSIHVFMFVIYIRDVIVTNWHLTMTSTIERLIAVYSWQPVSMDYFCTAHSLCGGFMIACSAWTLPSVRPAALWIVVVVEALNESPQLSAMVQNKRHTVHGLVGSPEPVVWNSSWCSLSENTKRENCLFEFLVRAFC